MPQRNSESRSTTETKVESDLAAEPTAEGREQSPGVAADLPMLSQRAATVYELLLSVPAHRGLTGKQIIEALRERDIYIEQSTLTTHILPQLKPYGLEGKRRVGYRIPQSRRPQRMN
ncbi:MAG: hypothetical protein WD768_20625 [Phycisphaeraceae bacterium]